MSKRKHTAYSLEIKLQVLKEFDEKKLTKTEICLKHEILNLILMSTILGSREKIKKAKGESKILPNKNETCQLWGHGSSIVCLVQASSHITCACVGTVKKISFSPQLEIFSNINCCVFFFHLSLMTYNGWLQVLMS